MDNMGSSWTPSLNVVVDDRGWDVTVEVPCTSTLVAVNAKNSNVLNNAIK